MPEPRLPYTESLLAKIRLLVEQLKVYELASSEFKDGYGQAIREMLQLLDKPL